MKGSEDLFAERCQAHGPFDVLLEQPVRVYDALAFVVLRTFAQHDAVLGGQSREGLPGESGLLRDVAVV